MLLIYCVNNTLPLMLRKHLHTMKHILIGLLSFSFLNCFCQTNDFDTLVTKFRERLEYDDYKVNLPVIHKGEDFNIILSESSLEFKEKEIVFENPNQNNSFPLSFSVIFKENIVSLFEPGTFVCHKLSDFSRNEELEKELNTKRFDYHWLINNNLCGLSNGKYWLFDSTSNWTKFEQKLPFEKKPKLFENKEYLAYCDCHGEWGGTVYFYNRANENTYFTEATCANSIIETDKGYKVLSHLGHGMGSADLKLIADPSKLSNLKDFDSKTKNINALGYSDKSGHPKTVFDFYWVQIFSSFNWNGQTIYMVNWQDRTFLSEIRKKDIIIVDPLFNSDLYTHDPITTQYENGVILMNLDFYGLGREREISMIIIKDKEITKIDWNNKH